MKNILFVIVCLCTFSLQSFADRPVDVADLPTNIQEFVKKHFPNVQVSYSKQDSDWLERDYTVVLTNGDKLEFNSSGVWKELDCKHNQVPATILPEPIKKILNEKHPSHRVVEFKKDVHHYDVKLSNKLEMEFSFEGKLLRYD